MGDSIRPSDALRGALLLASASARRHGLLRATGLPFEIEVADVDESLSLPIEPEVAAEQLAVRKAQKIARRHQGEDVWVLGADTVVAVGEGPAQEILGKPTDPADARRMLRALSQTRHRVVTGVAVIDCRRLAEEGAQSCFSGFERTWVSMRVITPAEVEGYVESGEWRGKAGGYAIQENADAFVLGLEEGGFDNVVGLPVQFSLELLRRSGAFLAP